MLESASRRRSESSEESVAQQEVSFVAQVPFVPSLRPRSSTSSSLSHGDAGGSGGLERDLARDLVLELPRFLRGIVAP